jgi:hypothetical protein
LKEFFFDVQFVKKKKERERCGNFGSIHQNHRNPPIDIPVAPSCQGTNCTTLFPHINERL